MAYDTELEDRIDKMSKDWELTKKKMFGGVGYLKNGNMAFGTHKGSQMILRAPENRTEELLELTGVRVFDLTGRPMRNWFVASGEALESENDLQKLLKIGYDFALNLPPKDK